jgi:hypothetical protein
LKKSNALKRDLNKPIKVKIKFIPVIIVFAEVGTVAPLASITKGIDIPNRTFTLKRTVAMMDQTIAFLLKERYKEPNPISIVKMASMT